DIMGDTWAVTIDRHGRIWTTATMNSFGVVRSYRVEDFAQIPNPLPDDPIRPVKQIAATIVSWMPGVSSGLPLGTTWMIQSDRAEAIPRKIGITTQDETANVRVTDTGVIFDTNPVGATMTPVDYAGGDFTRYTVVIPRTPTALTGGKQFRTQRVTVRNETAHLRWSADIAEGSGSITLPDVLARRGDRITILRNFGTFGAVTLLGYGVGFYDLNAIENNKRHPLPPSSKTFAEQLALTEGRVYLPTFFTTEAPPCKEEEQAPGLPCEPRSLTFTNDAIVLEPQDPAGPARFDLFALETRKGLVDISVRPKPGTGASSGSDPSQLTTFIPFAANGSDVRRKEALAFTGSYRNASGTIFNDHPSLVTIRQRFLAANRPLHVRFTGMARFDKDGRPYALTAAYNFGILVVDLTPPINPYSLADVIWLPAGAYGVRHIAGTHYATAVDGEGRSMLIDLSAVDERPETEAFDLEDCAMPCEGALFPTADKATSSGADPLSSVRFGSDDPRIIWKSDPDPDNVNGTLAPVADPDTGFVFSGELLQQTMSVLSGLDPKLTVKADLGNGFEQISDVVPLGIAAPSRYPKGALGAFRIEIALPGSMDESVGASALTMRVESQRVAGALPETAPPGWPAAAIDVEMHRIVPDTTPVMRYQKGWNFFVSDPVVVLADPRAAKSYESGWTTNTLAAKEAEGCFACNRPQWAADDPAAKEIYSLGRVLSVKPSSATFTGRYSYLADPRRLETTLGSVMADTVRPIPVQVAAQGAPVAGGMLQETLYLHSGEMETGAGDLDAGGRMGWNVRVGRTYRSRTLGWTAFGLGWDSPIFKRLRLLPTGDVEYRDGAEVWTFTKGYNNYIAPPGVFLKLTRNPLSGWQLVDQQQRIVKFDDYGRVVSESDEFSEPADPSKGNTIHYVYDADGRLARILDPVRRKTDFTYDTFTGLLNVVTDWRGRAVEYDQSGHLLNGVQLPEAKATSAVPADFDLRATRRPVIKYTYEPGGSASFPDLIELKTNLTAIKEPAAARPRVTFTYEPSDPEERDRMLTQKWATGEEASVDYLIPTNRIVVTDVLDQVRTYELQINPGAGGKRRLFSVTEHSVPVVGFDDSAPIAATPNMTGEPDFVTKYLGYNDHGQLTGAIMPNGLVMAYEYDPARGGAVGEIPVGVTQSGPGLSAPQKTTLKYETSSNHVKQVAREEGGPPQPRDAQTAHRNRKQTVVNDVDADVNVTTTYNDAGQVTDVVQTNATGLGPDGDPEPAPTPPPAGALVQRTVYYDPDAADPRVRSRAYLATKGGDEEKYNFEYFTGDDGGERVVMRDMVRGTTTITHYDAYDRKVFETVDAPGGSTQKWGYDGNGRLRYHSRQQTPIGLVETRFEYDDMNREVEQSVTKAEVNGTPRTVFSRTQWQLGLSSITRFDPTTEASSDAEPREVTTIDRLGRPILVQRTDTDGNRIRQVSRYDANGQLAYESDGTRVAVFRQHDILGRERVIRGSDGLRTRLSWRPWGELDERIELDSDGNVIARSVSHYTDKGRLRASNDLLTIDTEPVRQTLFTWSNHGKTQTATVGLADNMTAISLPTGALYRGTQTEVDHAGREIATKSGEANAAGGITDAYAATSTSYIGAVANTMTVSEPKVGATYQTTMEHDAMGRVVSSTEEGTYVSSATYDEAGNVRSFTAPGMPVAESSFDSRGLPTLRQLPGGGSQRFVYDARGTMVEFHDEAGEVTKYHTDSLGRVKTIEYLDGTTEETRYEEATGAVLATKDRNNQWLAYTYDSGGRVTHVWGNDEPGSGLLLVEYLYDAAKRLKLIRNKDAGVAFLHHDLLGRPTVTKTIRFEGQSGLAASPTILDVHTQKHTWSVYDERVAFDMPAVDGVPSLEGIYESLPSAAPSSTAWLRTITQNFDAGSNLTSQLSGSTILTSAVGRSTGRVAKRRRFIEGGGPAIVSDYGFADGTPSPVPLPAGLQPKNGLPLFTAISHGGRPFAGTSNGRDGAKRLDVARDLGMSRLSAWDYDGRSRLTDSWLQQLDFTAAPITDTLIDADFRSARTVEPVLTESQLEILGDDALTIERPSWTAAKTPTTHAIDSRAPFIGDRTLPEIDYAYTGARRTTAGAWTYTFDELGRMTAAESATLGRRLEYDYDPNNRIVTRRALRDTSGEWTPEDR
ncbi:MAG TPA: hypothetical protein VEU30_05500, partial [Thermoanaerobaculia bacterium]|nr:hypothetical protein [Thermoanaerobaculia bacterium]